MLTVWTLLAMAGFFGSNVSMRVCAEEKVSFLGGLMLRLCGMAAIGLLLLVVAVARGTIYDSLLSGTNESWFLWLVPQIPAFGICGAFAALQKAFAHQRASVFAVIVSSCPVVVFVLIAVIDQKLPTEMQAAGMMIAVLASMLFILSASLDTEYVVDAAPRIEKVSTEKSGKQTRTPCAHFGFWPRGDSSPAMSAMSYRHAPSEGSASDLGNEEIV